MSLIVFLIILAVGGLIVGALARLAVPGPDPMGIGGTILLGIGGSLIGGVILFVITGGRYYGAGWLVSLVCAVGIVYAVRRSRGGSLTDPGHTQLRR
jgi:uncharacterized membrane protein YeaQ/YmgE (transglycosylase-associated protein family)